MSAVVVAGATKGIGLEIAKYLSGIGYEVIGLARNFDKLTEKGIFYRYLNLDLSKPEEMPKLNYFLDNLEIPIIGLVNNVGKSEWKAVSDLNYDFLIDMFQTNVFSHFQMIQAILNKPNLKSIVTIGSIAGRRGTQRNSVYSASKFALNGLTQSLAKELGPIGVRVNTISPVMIPTPGLIEAMNKKDSPLEGGDFGDFLDEFAKSNTALGRLPTAIEVAKVVAFLLGEESSAITGQNINVDCGVFPQ